jgi:hypothetical protein
MEQVKYTLSFRASLNEEQEKILIGHIQHSLLNPIENELREKMKIAPAMIKEYMASLLADIGGHSRYWSYFKLEKKDEKNYVFTAPDIDALMRIKEIVKRVPFMPESKIYEKFLRQTIKDMGVEDGAYKIKHGR